MHGVIFFSLHSLLNGRSGYYKLCTICSYFAVFSCIREIVMAKCVSLIVVVHVATILATVFKFVPQAGKRFSSPIKTLQTLFKSTYKY